MIRTGTAPLMLFHREVQPDIGWRASIHRIPHYFALPSPEALADILQQSADTFLEIAQRDRMDQDLAALIAEAPDFAVGLTSQSTYHPLISATITDALNDRFGLSRGKRMQIMTCLQEALSNAVIHGNLCVTGERDSLQGFEDFYQSVDNALAEPQFQQKRVFIRAWDTKVSLRVCISHGGPGRINPLLLAPNNPLPEQKCGRGIFIIQSLAEQVHTNAECNALDLSFTY